MHEIRIDFQESFGFSNNEGITGPLTGAPAKTGIIDPTKVVRIALENAASVAGTLLLAEATTTEAGAA